MKVSSRGRPLRFRPVMMTATVAMLGLIPSCSRTGRVPRCSGRWPSWSSAALITSTLLTLVVLPTIYRWFDEEELKHEGNQGHHPPQQTTRPARDALVAMPGFPGMTVRVEGCSAPTRHIPAKVKIRTVD